MTTPGDGSDFKGHLVHRPGRIEADQQTIAELKTTVRRLEREHPALVYALEKLDTQAQTIADLRAETERWQEFANGYMSDLTAAEQTIAELRAELERAHEGGRKLFTDFEVRGTTIAELRKALEEARPYIGRLAGGQHVGKVLSQGEAVKLLGRIEALAAIAATEEGVTS